MTVLDEGNELARSPKTYDVVQKKRRFHNHVTAVPLGSKIRFLNQDKFFHHIYCPESSGLNVPEHRGAVVRKPKKLGKYELFCDIHPLMNAYIFVVPNDHFTSPKEGQYSLKNVPSGEYLLRVWHPRLPGKSYKVKVSANELLKQDIRL